MTNRKLIWGFSLPLIIFTVLFVALPFLYLVFISFTSTTSASFLSLSNYIKIWDSNYRQVYIDSVTLGLVTTTIVTLVGYPFGYFMAKLTQKSKKIVSSLLLIPFCVSSLLRLYGWDIIFSKLDHFIPIKYTYTATMIGMVYALLPFMIFAVYGSAEKLDWNLIEAARDLGATSSYAFRTISLPLTLPGLLSGIILTFIPSMGLIYIAEVLSGNNILLVGNLIVQEATQAKNRPFAAALAIVLMIFTSLFIGIYRKLLKTDELEGLV